MEAIAEVAVAATAVWCRLSGTDLCLDSAAGAAGMGGVAVGCGSTTVVTRNRDNLGADWLVGKKPVGEQLLDIVMPRRWPDRTPAPAVLTDDDEPSDDDDGGGVIGDVVALWDMVAIGLVSRTRDTWNRLRDGDGVGDGMGLGAGERRRPPDLRSPGFNRRSLVVLGLLVVVFGVPAWWAVTSADRMPGQVSEIFRELRCELCTRLLIAVVRTGSGFGGFSLRAHCARMLCTMRE